MDENDVNRLYQRINDQQKEFHDLSEELKVFMATQTIKNEKIDKLEKSYAQLATSSKKINSWIMAGGIVVVILAAIGKGAIFIYEYSNEIRDFFLHGK